MINKKVKILITEKFSHFFLNITVIQEIRCDSQYFKYKCHTFLKCHFVQH